jgi:1-acyl-sn-glycerol-3-phosphate acyltransferase
MKKILDYPLSIIFMLTFGLILLFFHPLQMLSSRIGYQANARINHAMMWTLMKALHLTGASYKVLNKEILKDLPQDKPLILVSNHQSMFDIPAIGGVFKAWHAKFISKKELARGTPSISWHLRHGKHAIIDRNNREQSLAAIERLAQESNQYNFAACIYPEGTRSRDGRLKPFKEAGFTQLYKSCPDAVIVPLAMDNFWRITQYKLFPIPSFIPLRLHILPPVSRATFNSPLAALKECELRIREALQQNTINV